eukprot:gene5757-2480_t
MSSVINVYTAVQDPSQDSWYRAVSSKRRRTSQRKTARRATPQQLDIPKSSSKGAEKALIAINIREFIRGRNANHRAEGIFQNRVPGGLPPPFLDMLPEHANLQESELYFVRNVEKCNAGNAMKGNEVKRIFACKGSCLVLINS